jgi:Lrp/AsnC family transcriptional regulator of ectoine degradation
MIKLDSYDWKILEILQREGRISKVKLAEAINLSPSPAWERLRRLQDAGVITGYQARLNLKKLVTSATVMVEVTLSQHYSRDFERFEKAIRDVPEVIECHATGGGVDYILKIVTRDIDSYQRLIDRLLEAGVGIDRYFSYIVTKTVKESAPLPLDRLAEKTTD